MSFRTQCLYCGQLAKAPDHLFGASRKCPKCGNFFTLVPIEEPLAVASSATDDVPPSSSSSSEIIATTAARSASADKTLGRRVLEPIGTIALLLAGAALFCAMSYSLGMLVVLF